MNVIKAISLVFVHFPAPGCDSSAGPAMGSFVGKEAGLSPGDCKGPGG